MRIHNVLTTHDVSALKVQLQPRWVSVDIQPVSKGVLSYRLKASRWVGVN